MSFEIIIEKGVCVIHFDKVDSTNSKAKQTALLGYDSPMLFIADCQTAGRGRLGRSFYSPDSTGLYMSYLYKPQTALSDGVAVTCAASVAVALAIEELTDLKPAIKWVNDIFVDGRKVCGILSESVTDKDGVTSIVVGIGININTQDFPEDLKNIAGSLKTNLNRELLAEVIIKHLTRFIETMPERKFIEPYKKRSMVLGKQIVFTANGKSSVATAIDIDNNGGLVVKLGEHSIMTLSTGEISVKIEE